MPVLLLTGYLGSGKTTLLNRILTNRKGIRFAVIVNDIGEVNIDASLIQKGGVVGQGDDSLVALQNGCICCTLRTDLIKQLDDLMRAGKFDYIVIEASGICEPEPIAQTICSIPSLGPEFTENGTPRLDCIVTVVDAARMEDEFGCGDSLKSESIDDEDIENLVIQQIEFCNIVLLNKVSDVAPGSLEKIRRIVRELNPGAQIMEADYADVDLESLLNTWKFSYRSTEGSAGWIRGLESDVEEEHHEHEHEHHHDHGEECGCGCHDHEHEHHHHADEVFSSWGLETIVPCDKDELKEILEELAYGNGYGDVLRAKGMLPSENPGEWYYFDLVPEEYEIRTGTPDYTGKVCVIGANLKEEELNRAFGRS